MRDRAVRRHQEIKVKRKLRKQYNSCIERLSGTMNPSFEDNAEKLKKVCTSPYSEDRDRSLGNRTVQERRHDITMKEQFI
ncbi:hypothetical protein [uncultured Desulfobacter sp.]|uniref:hypothetical protein n=1 Tax=uncultured Desulfobacter sp. TaxID=240139 RepID=UPI002AA6072D|nr:hypothetical protein [uncultured Desulfobacter sp.]